MGQHLAADLQGGGVGEAGGGGGGDERMQTCPASVERGDSLRWVFPTPTHAQKLVFQAGYRGL